MLLSEQEPPSLFPPEPWLLKTMMHLCFASTKLSTFHFCRHRLPCGLLWSSSALGERHPGRSPAGTNWRHHAAQIRDPWWLLELKYPRTINKPHLTGRYLHVLYKVTNCAGQITHLYIHFSYLIDFWPPISWPMLVCIFSATWVHVQRKKSIRIYLAHLLICLL